MKSFDYKSILPYVTAIVLFAIVSLAYFSPPILEGKKLKMHDVTTGQAMQKEISDFRDATGEEALWTNSMFSGMPAFQISVKYFAGFLSNVRSVFELWLPEPAGLLMLYMIGFYILLLVLGVNPWLAIPGAMAFGFSSYYLVIIAAGHIWKVRTIAFFAPTLAGILLTLRGEYIRGGVLTALFLTFQIFSNHIQMTYYFLIMVGLIFIFEFYHRIKEKELPFFFKAVGVVAIAGIIALGVNITNIWSTYEYGKYTIRGASELTFDKEDQTSGLDRSYVTGWSYGIGESWSFLIPNAKGGASALLGNSKAAMEKVDPAFRENIGNGHSHYWGDQPGTSGPVYMGAIIVFLFVLGMLLLTWRYKWALFLAAVLVIMLSWGKNLMWFTNLFLDYFPLYNKFRSVSSILVIAEFVFPLLAFMMLKKIWDDPEIISKKKKEFFIAFGLTGGIALVFYILPKVFFSFINVEESSQFDTYIMKNAGSEGQIMKYIENLEAARVAIFKADALRSFFFILITAALLWFFSTKKVSKTLLVVGLTLFIVLDMATIDKRYLGTDNFVSKKAAEVPVKATQADLLILKDTDPNYRVMNTTVSTFNDATTSYFHKSIGGYHGAKLQRYQDLIEHHIAKNNMDVLNMLNTKYFIYKGKSGGPEVQINMEALGNCWFVDNIKWVENADEEIMALNDFDPATIAIIDKRFEGTLKGFSPVPDSLSTIQQTDYKPNQLTYQSNSTKARLAVFSEIYYPSGWKVFIDNVEADYLRVNYVLRALKIPAGQHEIVFKFEPKTYFIGEKISVASSILLALVLIFGIFSEYKRMKKE
ncbi:MAG: YfhO family protein [Bacteroidales bacterium]|nr:YfhO family protein [Bacteroidales bacterium]MCF8457497.1 YfhO family protein [Bacteroidales bacterium]